MSTVKESYTSHPVTSVNTREVDDLSAEFVYNFYLKDEKDVLYTSPTSPIKSSSGLLSQKTVDEIENIERGSIRNRVPRYVKVTLSPQMTKYSLGPGEQISIMNSTYTGGKEGNFKNYLDPEDEHTLMTPAVVNKEGTIASIYAVSTTAADSSVQTRVYAASQRMSAAFLSQGNLLGSTSENDAVNIINEITSEELGLEEIKSIVGQASNAYIKYVNDVSTAQETDIERKASTRTNIKTNVNVYQDSVVHTSRGNPFNGNFKSDMIGLNPEGSPWVTIAGNPMNSAQRTPDGTSFEEIIPSIVPVSHGVVPSNYTETSVEEMTRITSPNVYLIGYIIERADNETGELKEFVILEPDQTSFYDTAVYYGKNYTYSSRQLYFVTGNVIQENGEPPDSQFTHDTEVYSYYIASAPGKRITVATVEKTPPEPVSILFCNFIYEKGNGIELRWQMPNNPTRDIKKYQVFRRKTG